MIANKSRKSKNAQSLNFVIPLLFVHNVLVFSRVRMLSTKTFSTRLDTFKQNYKAFFVKKQYRESFLTFFYFFLAIIDKFLFAVTLHDIVHTEKSLTLVFEYLERDLKQYMDDCGGILAMNNVKVRKKYSIFKESPFLLHFLEANHSYNCGLPFFFPTDRHPESLSDLSQTSFASALIV